VEQHFKLATAELSGAEGGQCDRVSEGLLGQPEPRGSIFGTRTERDKVAASLELPGQSSSTDIVMIELGLRFARLLKRRPVRRGALLREKERYEREVAIFNDYASQFGVPGLNTFFWHHSIDLKDGIVTPGDYDYRHSLHAFQFPDDMRGMKVLDVGSATGFFAFEFERRGADVYSVELPSLLDWDMIASERDQIVRHLMAYHDASSPEEAYRRHLNGPFEFCHQRRNSSVKRVYSTIYDLRSELFDGQKFDVVFLGDILLHLFAPLMALNVIAPLCKHQLIVTSDVMPGIGVPLLKFVAASQDARSWWSFSRVCLEQMLLRVGFRNVVDAGHYSGVMRRQWIRYNRLVIHATR
jgi:2-polyprenyl-3-methyl-5-hydroxy-6-metoxy-1,4-benzoquinol methylase